MPWESILLNDHLIFEKALIFNVQCTVFENCLKYDN